MRGILGAMAVVLAVCAPTEAATIVLANRGDEAVEFVIGRGGEWTKRYRLAPDKLVPVAAGDQVEIGYLAGGRLRREPLPANSLWYLRGNAKNIELSRVRFPMASSGPWLPVNGNAEPARLQPTVVPVKILVDDEQPAVESVWKAQATEQIDRLSDFIERYCGVRFEVIAHGTWTSSDAAGNDFRRLDSEFRRATSPDPGWLAIGFSSQLKASSRHMPPENVQPLDSHLMIPGLSEQFNASDQYEVLAHQLGHYLGACHVNEETSIMQPMSGHRAARRSSTYDPVNTLAMNLVADEIRGRKARSVEALPRGTRQFLFGLYTKLSEQSPRDRQLMTFTRLMRDPLPRRGDYIGVWADGSRASAGQLSPWYGEDGGPKLDGRSLFDEAEPIRWLLNSQLPPPNPPRSVVEMFGGDKLPGRVTGYRTGSELAVEQQPGHLLVSPHVALDRPGGPRREELRVNVRWVQRIIWEPVASRYQPATLIYRDGRRLDFEQLRMDASSVHLLRENGVQRVPLDELAELHFPERNPWEAHFEEMALLCPGATGRWIHWQTVDGLEITASVGRMEPARLGREDQNNRPENWYEVVQPAWCLDPLWINHPRVRMRRYFEATEIPLSRIPPAAVVRRSTLGGKWPWRVDRNVRGGPLQSGEREFAWGFGTHAFCELRFTLPASVRTFTTHFGLDQLAGLGGCVRAEVLSVPASAERPVSENSSYDEGQTKRLFQSPWIVGSFDVGQAGPFAFDSTGAPGRQLILRVDPAHEGRPEGTDPLDIRDSFDWLEPLLTVDKNALYADLFRLSPRLVAAWAGWHIATGQTPGARLISYRDPNLPPERPWQVLAASSKSLLQLSGRFQIDERADHLLVAVERPAAAPACSIRVFAEDTLLEALEVPVASRDRPIQPYLVSLAEYRGKQIELRLVQQAGEGVAYVRWKAARLISQSTVEDLGRTKPASLPTVDES